MRKIYFLYIFMLLAFAQSCKKDLGNYSYTDTPVVLIDTTGIGGTYSVLRYDNIQLNPKITIPTGHEASYKWSIYLRQYTNNVVPVARELSTTASLNASITEAIGAYSIELLVTDKTTGIQSNVSFNVNVVANLEFGMMVLYQTSGGGDVDFIKTPALSSTITSVSQLKSLYSGTMKAYMPGNAKFIANARLSFQPVNWLTVASDNYIARFHGNDFSFLREQQDIFRRTDTDIRPQAYVYTSSSYQALISGGKLYVTNVSNYEFDSKFGGAAVGDYELAPYLTSKVSFSLYVVAYDQKNGRFVRYFPSTATMVDFVAPTDGQPFNLRSIGKDMLFMGEGIQNRTYSVFKDKTGGNTWLYETDFNGSDNGTLAKAIYNMTSLPEIAQAKYYQVSGIGNFAYYATDKKIYNYAYRSSNTASVAFEVPTGETITSIKFYRPFPNYAVTDKEDRVLYVATWDGTKGKVYELTINETSGVIVQTPAHVFEVPGKVADISARAKGNG